MKKKVQKSRMFSSSLPYNASLKLIMLPIIQSMKKKEEHITDPIKGICTVQ
jgi:hypothetical protein